MSTDVLWNLDNRNKNLKINLVLKNGLCMVQTIVHAWCSVAFLCLNRNVHFFFLPGDRCCIILKMDLGTAEEISVFVVSEYWMCPLHYKCWKAGSLEEKGGNRRILLYIKPPFEFTETKMISPIHYISPRTNKMKYWPTISWQVNPTAAGRIMTLIVSWRANRCVDVYLVFNLKLEFVSGYLTYCSIITLFFQSSPL